MDHQILSIPCSYGASPNYAGVRKSLELATLSYLSVVQGYIANVNEELRGLPIPLDEFNAHVEEARSNVIGLLNYVQEREMGL